MGESIAFKLSLDEKLDVSNGTPRFGKEMLKYFMFDSSYRNLNHGSFGTFPTSVRTRMRELQDECEASPDIFVRYTFPNLIDEARAEIAALLHADVDTITYVPNATTAINTVLRNLVWSLDGKDEIIYFNTIYGACHKTIEHVREYSHDLVTDRKIQLDLPMEDEDMLELFRKAIRQSRSDGKTPRLALFDTISSMPGFRMPFEKLTEICAEEGVLSLIDGAHGVGHIPLDLTKLNPDFFVSNCHKWLYAPRGCAVFFVPFRNQALLRSTLPTSHGFVPRGCVAGDRGPLPANHNKSEYVSNFEFVGTIDCSPYLCVPEALKFRKEICGGEENIIEYCTQLVMQGSKRIAEILGTHILDNKTGTMANCCLVNVQLPISDTPTGSEKPKYANTLDPEKRQAAYDWMIDVLMKDHKTFIAFVYFQGAWWVRLSGQVYLEMSDFEWAGHVLNDLCQRVGRGEFLGKPMLENKLVVDGPDENI